MQEGLHIILKSDVLGTVFGVPITNSMLMSWIVVITLAVLGYLVGSRLQKIPGKLQTVFESAFSFFIDYLEDVLESRTLAFRFFPLIATLFMFILLGNWLELVPGIDSIRYTPPAAQVATAQHPLDVITTGGNHVAETPEDNSVALFRTMTTDLNVTLALAIIAFVIIEIVGLRYLGVRKHLGKFFNFHSVMGFFVGLIEFVSELVRLISFSFRLFGNMFAGEALILVAMFFVPLILPVPVMLYEVFVGFIQAAIFSLLTLFFIKLAMSEAH